MFGIGGGGGGITNGGQLSKGTWGYTYRIDMGNRASSMGWSGTVRFPSPPHEKIGPPRRVEKIGKSHGLGRRCLGSVDCTEEVNPVPGRCPWGRLIEGLRFWHNA